MATVLLSPNAKQQFFDNAGNPASGYKLHTYAANTLTPETTYTNRAGTVANQNPITLDARGEAIIYLTPGVMYDYVLTTAGGSPVWTREDVSADAGDADAVSFRQSGTGAVLRTTQDKLRDQVHAKDFGIVADGVTDDTSTLTAAITYAVSIEAELVLPPGDIVASGIVISAGALYIRGSEAGTQGTRIINKQNSPAITFSGSGQGSIENIGFIGESSGVKTLQSGLYLNNCQNVNLRNCVFDGLYDSIVLFDTVFFSQILTCRFFSVMRNHMRGTGTSGAGYAIRVSGCQITAPTAGGDTLYFENAGSLVFSDVGISPATATGRCLRLVSNALQSGIHQFSNCVFEGSALEACRIEGDVFTPIKYVYFSNCYFNQSGVGQDAVTLIHVDGVSFTNSYFSGTGSAITFAGNAKRVSVVNADLPGGGSVAMFRAIPGATIDTLSLVNINYTGANRLVDFSAITLGNLLRCKVSGGFIGSHVEPVLAVATGLISTDHWQTWTPGAPAPSSGSFTSASVSTARYRRDGNTMHVMFEVTITTNGTAAGGIVVTLPKAAAQAGQLYGRERNAFGWGVTGTILSAGTTVQLKKYDDAYPGGNSTIISVSGSYEVA